MFNVYCCYFFVARPVKAAECSIGIKLLKTCDELSLFFNACLEVSDCLKHIPESVLGL